jgi:hypothetical protein
VGAGCFRSFLTFRAESCPVVMKSRAVILGEKMNRDAGRLRLPGSLYAALVWWANENGYSVSRAVVVLLERALRRELSNMGTELRDA